MIIDKLREIGCIIQDWEISQCYRLYRSRSNSNSRGQPEIILVRWISLYTRDKVLGFKTKYNEGADCYMNEDMTNLQRKLFNYIRTKEDLIIKRTVGYRDGKIIFVLKENEHATSNKWSRVESLFDLERQHMDLTIDFTDESIMESLGMKNHMVKFNLE